MEKLMTVLFITIVLMAPLTFCNRKHEAKVLAVVNNVPITEYDLKQVLKKGAGHSSEIDPETSKHILKTLIRDELIYQKSLALGLDKNQQYRKKLSEAEAQLAAFKKQEMSVLFQNYIRNKAEVTDSEAQAYFEKNAARLKTKYHIWQIFYHGNYAKINKDDRDLKSGMPFEKVASRRFPVLPQGIKSPWDLGYIHWTQLPEPWQAVIDRLDNGKVSDIIQGPGNRFWVIKVVDKILDPNITFALEKDKIVNLLQKKKKDELYKNILGTIESKANIVFPN